MKKISILLQFYLLSIGVNAQNTMHEILPVYPLIDSQKVIGRVFYDFYWQRDSTNHEKDEHEKMMLEFSKEDSQFSSYSYYINDSTSSSNMEKYWNTYNSLDGYKSHYTEGIREKYYTQKTINYEVRKFLEIFYLIKDDQEPVWNIMDSTKIINGYNSQKATTESHGRHYTVWFTTDLPYPFGPRRLRGLPGLILEAYDSKDQIRYTINNILMYPTTTYIGIPRKSEKATLNQYENMAEAYRANYGKGAISVDGKEYKISNFTNATPKKSKLLNPYNNPIDLKN